MQYFFDVLDERTCFADREGFACSSRIAAGTHAALIARELAADRGAYAGYFVRVTDEAGRELLQVPVERATYRGPH